jgi:hypothetical protein
VGDAAAAIDQLGLLTEPPADAEPEAQPEPEATPEEEASPQLTVVPSAEPEPEVAEAEPEAKQQEVVEAEADEGTELELPDTLNGLAEAIGLEPLDVMALRTTVKVNGEDQEVTLAEAMRGYSAEADYTRKSMDLAEQRRAHETAVGEAQQEWQRRFEAVDALTQQLKTVVEGEAPNLEQILREQGPEAYWEAKANHDVKANALKEAEQAREATLQEQQQRTQEDAARYFAEQQRLVADLIPDFVDAEKGPQLKDGFRSYLAGKGFNAEEMKGVVDARIMDVIHDGFRYRQLQKALPKVIKPGAARDLGEVSADKRVAKVRRLAKTGSRADAAAVFGEFL